MNGNPQNKPEPKINLVIGIILLTIFFILDIVDIILKFAGLDDFLIVDIISYLFLVPYFFYYKYIKKADFSGHTVIMSLIELIPYIGTLPLRTIGLGMTFWIDRHPEGRIAKGTHVASKVLPARKMALEKDGKLPARGNLSRSARTMQGSDSRAGEEYKNLEKRKKLEARNKNPLNFVPGKYSKETGQIEDLDNNVYEEEPEEDTDQDYEQAA